MTIANTGEPVFVPAIGARPRMVVWKIIPGGAICTVVFARGSPRAFGEIRTPAFPVLRALARFFESARFRGHLPCRFRGCHEDRWYASGTLRRTYSTI